jgi:hypothetical protein
MKKNTFISIILCISIVFYGLFFANTRPAMAYTVADIGNLVVNIGKYITSLGQYATQVAQFVWTKMEKLQDVLGASMVVAAKVVALLAVQKIVALFIGEGDGSIIRDYNQYLYTSPQQRAMNQMNVFFNSVSRGRLSYLNYEGIGPNYDSYLVSQAKQMITGTTFVTNIQEQVSDPKQMFSGGNMKALSKFIECPNNVACYTLMASAQYDKELTKAQDIARSEQQNGFLPTKAASGRITKPAALAQNALLQVDQVGTQLIMNADPKTPAAALTQIAEGSVISIAARAINYGISDDAGKAAIVAQNNKFPFSLGYSSLGGVSLNGSSTKIGSVGTSGSTQIGNTSITGGINVNAAGAQVTSSTQKLAQ